MKRIVFFLILSLMTCNNMLWAEDVVIDGIKYSLKGNKATVIASDNKYSGIIVIPATFTHNGNNYIVTTIYSKAFKDCTDLTSVTISSSVNNVKSESFRGCTKLSFVILPKNIIHIGYKAFDDTPWYEKLKSDKKNISYNVIYINNVAYTTTTKNLTKCKLREDTWGIAERAFEKCTQLKTIHIPRYILSFSGKSFYECPSIEKITVDEDNKIFKSDGNAVIRQKGENVLVLGCKNTIIPDYVTGIEPYAFNNCTELTRINIPDRVTRIGTKAFIGCTNLKVVTVPTSVTQIDEQAFPPTTAVNKLLCKERDF